MILLCTVLFRQLPCISMGVVPGLMDSGQCVCMYVVDSPKRQEEAMNSERQPPSSFRKVPLIVYFTCRQGQGTDDLTSPPKDS